MTEYQENQQDKVELYVDYYDEIAEIEDAFEDEWEEFEGEWGTRLAQSLGSAEIVENPEAPDEFVSVMLENEDGEERQWTFRQGESDWSYMVPKGWWTKLDENRVAYTKEKPNARVGFIHRLDNHKDDALRNNVLIMYVRNAPSGQDDFYNGFAERFSEANESVSEAIKGTNWQITGKKRNILRAEYPIEVEAHDDFFEAYVDALVRGLREGAVENQELVEIIDGLYESTVEEDVEIK